MRSYHVAEDALRKQKKEIPRIMWKDASKQKIDVEVMVLCLNPVRVVI